MVNGKAPNVRYHDFPDVIVKLKEHGIIFAKKTFSLPLSHLRCKIDGTVIGVNLKMDIMSVLLNRLASVGGVFRISVVFTLFGETENVLDSARIFKTGTLR